MFKDHKKGGFGGKKFGGGKNFNRDGGFPKPELHKAVCAECDAPCMVPFKPNGKKPIFCSNCFVKEEGGSTKRFDSASSGSGDMKAIISRLDTIISLLRDEE